VGRSYELTMSLCLDRLRLANLIAILLLLFFRSQANAQIQDIASIFESANQYYAQSNYTRAIEQYEKVLKSAIVSDVVLYNLGNAYFKNNQLGKAILCYEKAQRLAPRDREIAENLNFARARIADKVERTPENSFLSQLRRVTDWLSLDAETALAVALFFAANASFSIFWLDVFPGVSRWAFYAFVVLLGLVLVLGTSNAVRIYWQETVHEGIVLVEKADVLSGPAADSPTLFSIHEGLKVRIENVLPDWTQISLENGWNGWIRKDTIDEI
jgi:tetratricopeptide (TPR) repeat protein